MSLESKITELIESIDDDARLARELNELAAKDWEFWRSAGTWGPVLYERNRVVFLPLIERNLTPWNLRGLKTIEAWMESAEANGDARLYRSLLQAFLQNKYDWNRAAKRWAELLIERLLAAPDKKARKFVLDAHDLWYDLEDAFAVELYAIDPELTVDFVIQRLDRAQWYDVIYEKLAEAAKAAGDDEFYYEMYRRTFRPQRWEKDAIRLCRDIADPDELVRELERRHLKHPEGGVAPAGYWKIFEARGRDVLPYLERHVPDHESWGGDSPFRKMIDHAASNGWWDIWGLVGKYQQQFDAFSKLIEDTAADTSTSTDVLAARLMMLAGSKSGWAEWRFPTVLSETAALALYERFPELARGPFAQHFTIDVRIDYTAVAKLAHERGDDAMVDLLLAKALQCSGNRWQRDKNFQNLGWYRTQVEALARAPEVFASRALRVLQHLAPFRFNARVRRLNNPLYPIFFGEPRLYAPIRGQARDLLESDNDAVRTLAVRLITLEHDDIGRELAARNTDHLLAVLLDEAPRGLRLAAFEALALAAQSSETLARHIHQQATILFDLERRQYPRDRLIELVGKIIHHWPALRKPSEQPVIYRRESA